MTEYKITLTKIDAHARFDETLKNVEKHIIGEYSESSIKSIAEHIKQCNHYDYYTIEKRELHEKDYEVVQVR